MVDPMNVMAWMILIGVVLFIITILAAFVGCVRWVVLAILWAKDRSHPVTAGGEKIVNEYQIGFANIFRRKASSIRKLFHRSQRYNS